MKVYRKRKTPCADGFWEPSVVYVAEVEVNVTSLLDQSRMRKLTDINFVHGKLSWLLFS